MSIKVFNRYEKKFLLDKEVFEIVQKRLLDYMHLDKYHKNLDFYPITNIYYDTEDNYLIRHSLSKPKYKEKLRIRAYGIPKDYDRVYIEIKKKYNGAVNKRRCTLKLCDAYAFLENGNKPKTQSYINRQVLNEIEFFMSKYNLSPKLYLAYERRAMFSKTDRDLRITFDSNIRFRRGDLRLEQGDYGEVILPEGVYLMEIKTEKSLPIWLVKLLSENKIYSSSFSKYGKAHMNMVTDGRLHETGWHCFTTRV